MQMFSTSSCRRFFVRRGPLNDGRLTFKGTFQQAIYFSGTPAQEYRQLLGAWPEDNADNRIGWVCIHLVREQWTVQLLVTTR